jgi:hypothetical protein
MHTHFFRAAHAAAGDLLPTHVASAAVVLAALVPFAPLAATSAPAQSFEAGRVSSAAHEVSTIYDRLTDSTRVSVALKRSSRSIGRGSRVWLDVSFTYAGARLTARPEAVVLSLASFTPARRGWAFAHPQRLRVVAGAGLELDLPAGEYQKLRAVLFDAGRREMLFFRIPTDQFVEMAAQSELELKAGRVKMRLRGRAMGMLREVVRRLTPAPAGVR